VNTSQQDQNPDPLALELWRFFIIGVLAFLMFGLSVLLDGPVTVLSWLLTAAGFLCLAYLIIASRYLLKHGNSQSPKADS
jgi:hypothetical protein